MATLSVVVITKNEEANMPEFLDAYSFADEIVVVDEYSEDRTVEICRAAGPKVKVIQNHKINLATQWNVALDAATCDWILEQDADYRPTPELVTAIKSIVEADDPEYDVYYIPRRNIAFGKWIRHCGWYPDLIRPHLFRRGKARFDERKGIHTKILYEGKAGIINADIIHYCYSSIEQYVDRLNNYTTLDARDRFAMRHGKTTFLQILWDPHVPWSAKGAYLKHFVPFSPLMRFLYMYVYKRGFLDGKHGLLLCTLSAFYEVVVNAKVWLMEMGIGGDKR